VFFVDSEFLLDEFTNTVILLSSPFVATLFKGASPRFRFEVNGRVYSNVYFLVDGIYPELSVFVKTFTEPQGEMRAYFAMRQEAKRKDIERGPTPTSTLAF